MTDNLSPEEVMGLLKAASHEVERLLTESDLDLSAEDLDPRAMLPDLNHIAHRFWTTEPHRVRLSHGSDCARRIWYSHNMPEMGKDPDFLSRITFAMGDLWESLARDTLQKALTDHQWLRWVKGSEQKEVEIDGVTGHIDGMLATIDGKHIVVDFKSTTSFPIKQWDMGRIPSPMWGNPYQAANYMAALEQEGYDIVGFLWPAHCRDQGWMRVGYASYEELVDYRLKAREMYDAAIMGLNTPEPCHPDRDRSPCRSKGKVYCPFYDYCLGDPS